MTHHVSPLHLYQHTVASSVSCAGIALHTGAMVNMVIKPAPVNTGIVFIRRDVELGRGIVPALYNRVNETTLGTTITNRYGVSVSTIEHVMAAIWGYGIDNAVIELDGPEVPVMDGSSEPFTFLLECTGRQAQAASRRRIELLRDISAQEGASTMQATPAASLQLDITIAFPHRMITTQKAHYDFAQTDFKQALCRARTFGFERDVERMREAGLALGGSLHNAIVLSDDDILNEGGLRYNDEFVRHKALDCVGDFFLAGGHLLAHVEAHKPGHGVNNMLLRAIFEDASNYRILGGESLELPEGVEAVDLPMPYDKETAKAIQSAAI
jgi:UDP-3-O-[3-hydroxymyristoyl] N-acetylglucosamine deacetylase